MSLDPDSDPSCQRMPQVFYFFVVAGNKYTLSINIPEYKPIVISNSSRQKFFRADHPFFFAIRSENVTYLMGHVVEF